MKTSPKTGSTDEALAELSATIDRINASQDALLINGTSVLDQLATMMGLLRRLIEIVTPDDSEQKGPTLPDLLAHFIAQQTAMLDIMKHTLETVGRIEERTLEAVSSATPCSISGK